MTKLFRVIPKRVKCSNGIGLTPIIVVLGEYTVAYPPFFD